jgi:hypothetical protein
MKTEYHLSFDRLALKFAQCLINAEFLEAHELLVLDLQKTISVHELKKRYEAMVAYFDDKPSAVEVIETLDDWPDKQLNDIGWAYVAISGSNCSEAVISVIMGENNHQRIRSIEWGRP